MTSADATAMTPARLGATDRLLPVQYVERQLLIYDGKSAEPVVSSPSSAARWTSSCVCSASWVA